MKRNKVNRKSEPQKLIHIRLPESTQQFVKAESEKYGMTTNSYLRKYIVELQEKTVSQ